MALVSLKLKPVKSKKTFFSINSKGVHVETILSNLGALAGFGCQMGIREALIVPGHKKEEEIFIKVTTDNQENYFFGDFLNEPLFSTKEGRISVFALVGGAAHSLGAKKLPDLNEMAGHYADKLGDKEYCVPRLP